MSSQLENKLKEKVDEEHIDKITFTDQLDRFHGVVSNCIHLWVQSVMSPCEGALNAMVKVSPVGSYWYTVLNYSNTARLYQPTIVDTHLYASTHHLTSASSNPL